MYANLIQSITDSETRMNLRMAQMRDIIEEEISNRFMPSLQSETLFGLQLGIVVSTMDPMRNNRVQFFCPRIHDPVTIPINQLPWAVPISNLGGFDDCGVNWVPPAGSYVCLIFEQGHRDSPFYLGTTWYRQRSTSQNTSSNTPSINSGSQSSPMSPEAVPEYQRFFNGHRDGYLVGANNGTQVFPQHNTESYHSFDPDSTDDIQEAETSDVELNTIPNIYSLKTPEKHMIKMVDGDPKCNRRWKRMEFQSSTGQYMIFKDDHLHYCGEWSHPDCQSTLDPAAEQSGGTFSTDTGEPNYPDDPDGSMDSSQQGTTLCPSADELNCSPPGSPPGVTSGILMSRPSCCNMTPSNIGINKYFKHMNECEPFVNNGCYLNQSGIQIRSKAGYAFVMDESVEKPRGVPDWEYGLQKFDFDGCTGLYKGRTMWLTPTGHCIEMNDDEDYAKNRSKYNGIRMQTATGNLLVMSDHSLPSSSDSSGGDSNSQSTGGSSSGGSSTGGGGDCTAGTERGIHMKSTSKHTFEMVDDGNMQCSMPRMGCAQADNMAKNAFIRLRSGYGLEIRMSDDFSQQKTQQQYIEILSPQKDNITRGPHILHMQEVPDGPGQVFLRSGGDYINMCYDSSFEVVGDVDNNPSDKIEYVTRSKIMYTKETYFNKCGIHCVFADEYVLLLARNACQGSGTSGTGCGPCMYPVVVSCSGIPDIITKIFGLKSSEFVFASSKACPQDMPCSSDAATATPGSGAGGGSGSNSTGSTAGTGAGSQTTSQTQNASQNSSSANSSS